MRVPLEVLNLSLVLVRPFTRGEGPKISPLSSLGVQLSRVQAVVTGSEFSDHFSSPLSGAKGADGEDGGERSVFLFGNRTSRMP